MKKSFTHLTRSSTITCRNSGCGTKIKMNLITRKPTKNSFDCYKCFKAKEFIRKNKKK